MNLFNKKVRSVDEIVATFDKTLEELKARVVHDEDQIANIQEQRSAAIREHEDKLQSFKAEEAVHANSKHRASRIADKITALLN